MLVSYIVGAVPSVPSLPYTVPSGTFPPCVASLLSPGLLSKEDKSLVTMVPGYIMLTVISLIDTIKWVNMASN